MMRVAVDHVRVPAMSTIGYGYGVAVETGEDIVFAGDHRPMRGLAEAVQSGESVEVELEPWQILERRPAR